MMLYPYIRTGRAVALALVLNDPISASTISEFASVIVPCFIYHKDIMKQIVCAVYAPSYFPEYVLYKQNEGRKKIELLSISLLILLLGFIKFDCLHG